jgi:hypothetical protein
MRDSESIKKSKRFFFEKKKQKTFASAGAGNHRAKPARRLSPHTLEHVMPAKAGIHALPAPPTTRASS